VDSQYPCEGSQTRLLLAGVGHIAGKLDGTHTGVREWIGITKNPALQSVARGSQ